MTVYNSLIIAGIGTIGGAFLKLGRKHLTGFNHIRLVDINALTGEIALPTGTTATMLQGDIQQAGTLEKALADIPLPAIFLNLCPDTDTVAIRRHLAENPVAYLDAMASVYGEEIEENRFSRLMPYTLQQCHKNFPHLICQGVNPGLVELVARMTMHAMANGLPNNFSIVILEHDSLYSASSGNGIAVGWSPKSLVEEVMLAPSLYVKEGRIVEDSTTGTDTLPFLWNDILYKPRLVGHEDIWNLSLLPTVGDARFLYLLHPRVMDTFEATSEKALDRLYVPDSSQAVYGKDSIRISVYCRSTGSQKTLEWEVDHHEIWKAFGINGVQYQTATALLFSVLFLRRSDIAGASATHTMSSIPLNNSSLAIIDRLFGELGILWKEVDNVPLTAFG